MTTGGIAKTDAQYRAILDNAEGRYSAPYAAAIGDLLLAITAKDRAAQYDARARLAKVISETMGLGEVIGATMALRRAAASLGASQRVFDAAKLQRDRVALLTFASEPPQLIVPRVTFEEALEDMVQRTPVTLKDAAERTSARIGQLYSEGKVAAFVKAAEQSVTEKAQSIISKAIREGIPEFEVGRALADNVNGIREASEEWSDSYSRMAFRTNLNTATTAGRFRQVQDPDIAEVIPALMFVSSNDADTRPNHLAAHGIIMVARNPDWRRIAPPIGYGCRCTVDFVSRGELEDLGRIGPGDTIIEDKIPPGAKPDEGFVHSGYNATVAAYA